MGTKACDVKVRGRSGVWSDFKGSVPPGRIVLGVVNPREPDIIFFQLKKTSPFLFAAKRTCFQGETPYVEDPIEAQKSRKLKYPFVFLSFIFTRDSERVSSTESLVSSTMIGCPGAGYEWTKGFYRFYTGLCLGLGSVRQSSTTDGPVTDYLSIRNYHFPIYLGGYYDLPNMPYAAGLEATLGFSHTRIKVSEDTTESSTSFNWSLGMAWRFYYENWKFVPKVGLFDGFGSYFGEFQVGYYFY